MIEGKGEGDYMKEVAEGERAAIAAYSSDGKAVGEREVAAHLTRTGQQSWQSGVSQAADGKVIVTGSPGTIAPSAEGLVASLAGVATTVAGALKPPVPPASGTKAADKPEDKKPEGESVENPPSPMNDDDEDEDDDDDE